MSLSKGLGSEISCLCPFISGLKLARLEGEEISQCPTKEYLGRGEASGGARIVPVCEESSGKPVRVKTTIGKEIITHQTFC